MNYYKEEHRLPSNGVLEDLVHDVVTLRNMTTAEEKMLLGSSGEKVFDMMIKECVVSPEDLDIGDLLTADKHFMIIKLRILSFGSDYPVSYTHSCGDTSEYILNLEELPVHYLPDDFVEPYDEFKLPVCGDTIALKVPRNRDIENINKKVKRFNKKYPSAKGDISYIYRLSANIFSINGEDKTESELESYMGSLHSKDSSYIKHRIGKLEVGIDTTIITECNGCGEDIDFELPFNESFFRSRFSD